MDEFAIKYKIMSIIGIITSILTALMFNPFTLKFDNYIPDSVNCGDIAPQLRNSCLHSTKYS